jgi:hypothetical protein
MFARVLTLFRRIHDDNARVHGNRIIHLDRFRHRHVHCRWRRAVWSRVVSRFRNLWLSSSLLSLGNGRHLGRNFR